MQGILQQFVTHHQNKSPLKQLQRQMKEVYDRAWKSIIHPIKFTHRMSAMCPQYQTIDGQVLERIDLTFKNKRGSQISAVMFKEINSTPDYVLLYLHGNGGSKLQSLGFLPLLCSNKTALISFDFVGCGNSEEGFLTYGVNQSLDAEEVLNQARQLFPVNKVIVWGRSMGAVTTILFCQRNKHIVEAMILDCPFQKLSNVVQRVIASQTSLPSSLVPIILYFLSKKINTKLGLEIFQIDYLQRYRKCCKTIPSLFFYSQKDKIVPKEEILKFFQACQADKQLVEISEEHEEQRCMDVLETGLRWIKTLKRKKVAKLKLCYTSLQIETEQLKISSARFCCH